MSASAIARFFGAAMPPSPLFSSPALTTQTADGSAADGTTWTLQLSIGIPVSSAWSDASPIMPRTLISRIFAGIITVTFAYV